MSRPTIAAELEDLRALQAVVQVLVRRPASDLEPVRAEVSGWSALQHAAHVTLANELVLRNLRSLAQGTGMFVVQEAEMKPQALAVLESGALPRGRAQSPRMVTPPAAPELEIVREWVDALSVDLDGLTREWPVLAAAGPRGYVPHQLLGPLDAAHWARFAVVHTRHHLRIVRDVLAALAGAIPPELEESRLQRR